MQYAINCNIVYRKKTAKEQIKFDKVMNGLLYDIYHMQFIYMTIYQTAEKKTC